jgi:hypothetical protein
MFSVCLYCDAEAIGEDEDGEPTCGDEKTCTPLADAAERAWASEPDEDATC